MTKDQEEERKNSSDSSHINRGFELMLRSCEKKETQRNPWFRLRFEKIFPFFGKKEVNFFLDFSLDIRKIAKIK